MSFPSSDPALKDIRGLAADSQGTLYALAFTDGNSITRVRTHLYAINVEQKSVNLLNSWQGFAGQALEWMKGDTVYTWHGYQHLLALNLHQGSWLDFNSADNGNFENMQTLARSQDGRLFAAREGSLYLINAADGIATLFVDGVSSDIRGMAFIVPEPNALCLAAAFIFSGLSTRSRQRGCFRQA